MRLDHFPDNVLEDIALEFATVNSLGPPSPLTTLLLVSKRINFVLKFKNRPTLYARIFHRTFDHKAPRRRGLLKNARDEASELVDRFISLKRLKRGCDTYPRYIYKDDRRDGGLRVDMWMAFRMFLENDGQNGKQLVLYANVDKFAFNWIKRYGRLHDGKSRNKGWVLESELNSLAMWLFWFTDKDRIASESPDQRAEIITSLSPIYACQFKYMHQRHLSLSHWSITPFMLENYPVNVVTMPLVSPNHYYHSPPCIVPVLPSSVEPRTIILSQPLLTPAVILSFMCREEHAASLLPLRFPENYPMTRVQARAQNFPETSPVGQDYLEAKATIRLRTFNWRGEGEETEASRKFDVEWARLKGCWADMDKTVPRGVSGLGVPQGNYKRGMFSRSIWAGQWKHIVVDQYELIRDIAYHDEPIPPDFATTDYASTYMKLRIQEHFCHSGDPRFRVPFDETLKGQLNAWMPEGTTLNEQRQSLVTRCSIPKIANYEYSTYNPYAPETMDVDSDQDDNSPFGDNIHDILLTANTEETFGRAWSNKESLIGRIRPWDHLIVFIRNLPEKTVGRWIFVGYLHSDDVLIGRWRETGTPASVVGWGGTYYLQMVPDEVK